MYIRLIIRSLMPFHSIIGIFIAMFMFVIYYFYFVNIIVIVTSTMNIFLVFIIST